MSSYTPRTRHGRRDRGVALPSPVAAISIVAIVVAAIAFAVTGFGGNKTKVIPNSAPTTSISSTASTSASSSASSSSTTSSSPTPTATASAFTTADKAAIHVSIWNASTTAGLAEKVSQTVKAAGWTNFGTGTTHRHYAATIIYYPHTGDAAKWKAAAEQLGLDLGITNLSTGDAGTPQDRLTLLLTGPLS